MRFLLLAVALAACATDDFDATEQASTAAFANDKAAYQFFIGKGLTNFQAAGIVGNLDQESGDDPSSVQSGGGPGRGIAQWSVGGRWDTSSGDNLVAYASQHGEGAKTLQAQLEFIWFELTTHGYGYTQFEATTNITDATIVFMSKYEICGTCASSQRVAYAKAVLAAYGATPDYGATYVSQSWPLASAPPLQIKCGETIAAKIVLQNTGAKAWSTDTMLATTMPRDRASIFQSADWLAANRAATSGAVAPGSKGTFAFELAGPTGDACVPGVYHEHFGLVQDGVTWFSATAEGGPADDQLEALIELVPADATVDPAPTADPTDDGAGGCASAPGAGLLPLVALLAVRRRRAQRTETSQPSR